MGLGLALRPLEERQFRLLWLGRVTSAAGDAVVPVALAFAVLSVNRSATALGGVLAVTTVSRVAFTLVGGVVADRLPRRAVMLACDVIRLGVEAAVAALLITNHMTLPLFFVYGAIFGTASAFFVPASDGLVPQTLPGHLLQEANALLALSRNAVYILGPAVSGVLVATVGPGWAFAIDAATFAASAAFLFRMQIDAHARAVRSRFLTELRTGFGEVASRGWVRAPLIGFAISNYCLAAFMVLGPIIFREHFSASTWGIVSATAAAGGLAGSLLAVRLKPRRPLSTAFSVSMLLAAPLAALAGPLPVAVIAVGTALGFSSIALANTWWETVLQQRIPQHVYSRVRSYDLLVSFVFMPVGLATFPLVAQWLGYEETLLVAAAGTAVANLLVALTPSVHEQTRAPDSPTANQVPGVPAEA
jgi:MFS family permease